jgi:formyltetrahydrofolate deformylase
MFVVASRSTGPQYHAVVFHRGVEVAPMSARSLTAAQRAIQTTLQAPAQASVPKPAQPAPVRRGSGVLRIDPAAIAAPESHAGVTPAAAAPAVAAANAPARSGVRLVLGASSATLLVSAPASEDLSLTFASLLSRAGARVLESEACTSGDGEYLFQRIHADVSFVPGGVASIERQISEAARLRRLRIEVERAARKRRVALFVSKFDHCLFDLLLRHRSGELDCEMPLVISNHPELRHVARQFGIEFAVVPKTGANKLQAERDEFALLESHDVDLVVLARYMQVLSDDFVSRWEGRVINIHHSFLPAFTGAKPYHQAQQRGVKLIGATAHYASATLDDGPIIEQDVVRCTHRDTVDDLLRKGRDLERQVLAKAVRWHLQNRVIVHGNTTVVFA